MYNPSKPQFVNDPVPIYQNSVIINDATIKLIPAGTTVTLIVAPGPNKIIIPLYAILYKPTWAAEYTGVESTLQFRVRNSAGVEFLSRLSFGDAESFFIFTPGSFVLLTPIAGRGAVADVAPLEAALADSSGDNLNDSINKALIFDEGSVPGAFTGGDPTNTLRIVVTYMIFNTVTGLFE